MTAPVTERVNFTVERVGPPARSLPIEVRGLTKRYGRRTVVRDLSFWPGPGE
jgi:hypothetical protein